MTARTASRLAWLVWGLAVTAAGLGAALMLARDSEDVVFGVLFFLMTLGYSTVGALIARRHHRNAIGWLLLLVGAAFAVGGLAENYFQWTGRSAAAALISQLAIPVAVGSIPLVLVLFPDGRLPSPRWRVVVGALAVGWTAGLLGTALRPGRIGAAEVSVPNPLGIEGFEQIGGVLATIGAIGGVGASMACIAGLVLRYRRSSGEERQQMRWLAYVGGAVAILLVLMFGSAWVHPVLNTIAYFALSMVLAFGIPVATGIAILKYRLYDLDVVVKKTVVAAVLAAFVTLAYFIVVVSIPTIAFGAGGGLKNTIPFLAAAVLALAFQPVRRWARQLADRLVYGKRATPYEVLAEFSDRVGGVYATEDVLPRMARLIGEGSGARRAEVWLRVGSTLRREAVWPEEEGRALDLPLAAEELPRIPDVDVALPVRHQGDLLGAIAVSMARTEPLTPSGAKLLQDLSAQAGLVLRNVGLTADLRARLDELRASRKRLVAAQDDERRRLERNIHDGAQQQLVALAVKLRLVETLAAKEPQKAAEIAGQAKAELQEALEDLRDLARGIYPPLLADKGLPAALEAQARKSPLPVEIHPDGVGRYPAEAEAAVYFCVLEALQNAAKYAGANKVEVRLEAADGELRFAVIDDGRGFDLATTAEGTGLQNMADRVEALGGSLEIRSAPGEGTSVAGRVPATGEVA